MSDKDPGIESKKLQVEAKAILNGLFLSVMNVPNANGQISLEAVDRLVDCIVCAAMLEVMDVLRQGSQERADSASKVSCGGSCSCNQS
jgi:hypothetical protein